MVSLHAAFVTANPHPGVQLGVKYVLHLNITKYFNYKIIQVVGNAKSLTKSSIPYYGNKFSLSSYPLASDYMYGICKLLVRNTLRSP